MKSGRFTSFQAAIFTFNIAFRIDFASDPDLALLIMISIHPLDNLPEVEEGENLSALLRQSLVSLGLWPLKAGDVLVVTQKILSKAEGRSVPLASVEVSAKAKAMAASTRKDPRLVELILRESSGIVRAVPHVLITRHRLGHVMANSGIDQSNIGPGDEERALLLPVDPDGSAAELLQSLADRDIPGVGIVISDSFGRPWRHGVVGIAIGAAGLPSLVDRRGEQDRDGRRLEVTQIALADQIASAATLVMGEGAEGVPAALLRGVSFPLGNAGASALIRPVEEDLFT
ncbi:coenzyme F420-0:L-glutamate ligase [Sphingobium sp. CR2-8]|uniref:coenzyme F420-0:L-glutamate ligase n=1 Tax=Sphingobium sp. CR2-8 TaxID=1306534 RepID=UPI002DC02B3A|nr:coenzyme F420-0:L-glutamate ligase [Sphingobium sp. CR2-8]MEC3909541.1 coenzyme F420-0:L-glutamate ligase [Sphingobium sp. CR2-8]